jgi:hypothetical protein
MESQTASKTPKYQLIETNDNKDSLINTAIEITEGDYAGTKWLYGKAYFNQTDNGQMIMKFEYELLDEEADQASPELIDIMGDILVEILEKEVAPVEKHLDLDIIQDDPDLVGRVEELKQEAEKQRQESNDRED